MASAYGRGGVQRGSTRGTSISQAYGFAPKEATQYLSGSLGQEYREQQKLLSDTGPTTAKQKKKKEMAAGKLGRLRDVAEARGTEEFARFAAGKSRAHKATAGSGLVTREKYGDTEFGSKALNYRAAMSGEDPRVQLAGQFRDIKEGKSAAFEQFGYTPPDRVKLLQSRGFLGGMARRRLGQAEGDYSPEQLYAGGQEGYKDVMNRRRGSFGLFRYN